MRRYTNEEKEAREAAQPRYIPDKTWSLLLAGKLSEWDRRFAALGKLRDAVNSRPDLFNGRVPDTYRDLSKKFTELTELIKKAME